MADVIDRRESHVEEPGQDAPSTVRHGTPPPRQAADLAFLLRSTQSFAEEVARRPNLGLQVAPKIEIERLHALGLLTAPFPPELGGLGLGVLPGTHLTLLRLFSIVGGADLALGRLFEGHVNGLLLVERYGTPEQIERLAAGCAEGMLSGVWNTGRPELMTLEPQGDGFRFKGAKTFATGAAFVRRPIVTAELLASDGAKRGWQMTLPRMETLGASIDRSFWHPFGMESSESFGVDFTGGTVAADELIGAPGDFYRDPLFRGGAIRFAAVQSGAVLRLHAMFAEWLDETRRGEDPYQIARLGEIAIAAQACTLWVEKAAAVAEESLYREEKDHAERMIECANMMRTAIERLATGVMDRVTAGVGAHGLLQPQRFERVLRDLTMYLRQPAPDATLAAVGRVSLSKAHRRSGGAQAGFWSGDSASESLPTKYFQRIYERRRDPWEFETSAYEHGKYDDTLENLPRPRFRRGLEIGCSIGVMTKRLSERCDHLLALDVSERALVSARERCAALSHVEFKQMRVPDEFPTSTEPDGFDLVLLSEVGYYWHRDDLWRAASGIAERQPVGGILVLVHLTEFVPDYPLTGDQVHDLWAARPEWRVIRQLRRPRFRIDVLERTATA